MKNDNNLYQSKYKILPALLMFMMIYTVLMPKIASAQNSSVTKSDTVIQDVFGEKFREGRDLIDRQEWARAANKFREAVEKSPDHKLADSALYWLAFCYKKQKKIKEAYTALDRLIKNFPASPWVGDAQVMKLEIAPWGGERSNSDIGAIKSNINSKVESGKFSSDLQKKVIKGAINDSSQNMTLEDKPAMSERMPLDRADEIKLAAFKSLLTAAPKRAIETMGEVLKPDSKASETLKQEILRIWRNPRLFASQTLVSNVTKTLSKEAFMSLLRETLVKGFQDETNPKIRKEIIHVLAGLTDNQTIEYLKKLYATENDREVKKAIIGSISSSSNIFDAFGANQKQKAEFDISREETRRIGLDILLEIIRNEKDIELRRMAFANLSRFSNWSVSEQAVVVMTNLYDAESDEEFKLSLIRAFAESKQTSATGKLLAIAKNDKSDNMKLEAIYALRTSNDPEVIKFLENLIK